MTDGGLTLDECMRMHGYDQLPESYFFWLGEEWQRMNDAMLDDLAEFIDVEDLRW